MNTVLSQATVEKGAVCSMPYRKCLTGGHSTVPHNDVCVSCGFRKPLVSCTLLTHSISSFPAAIRLSVLVSPRSVQLQVCLHAIAGLS